MACILDKFESDGTMQDVHLEHSERPCSSTLPKKRNHCSEPFANPSKISTAKEIFFNLSFFLCISTFYCLLTSTFKKESFHRTYTLFILTHPVLAGPFGIRARRVLNINGRLTVERPPTSAVPSSGGRAASLTPLSPL